MEARDRNPALVGLLIGAAFFLGIGVTSIYHGLSDGHQPASSECLQALDQADTLIQTATDVSSASADYFGSGDIDTLITKLSAATDTAKASTYDQDSTACREGK